MPKDSLDHGQENLMIKREDFCSLAFFKCKSSYGVLAQFYQQYIKIEMSTLLTDAVFSFPFVTS